MPQTNQQQNKSKITLNSHISSAMRGPDRSGSPHPDFYRGRTIADSWKSRPKNKSLK